MKPRRRYPLLLRLARIDRELDHAATMLDMLANDTLDNMVTAQHAAQRVLLLAGLTAGILLACGIDGGLITAWLAEMDESGNPDSTDALGAQIVEQLFLAYGGSAGEA